MFDAGKFKHLTSEKGKRFEMWEAGIQPCNIKEPIENIKIWEAEVTGQSSVLTS